MKIPDGLELRTAAPADLDQIAALLTSRGEKVDAVDHRLVVEDPDVGLSSCAVVVDGDRVVSTATLLDETMWLGGVPIPTGQLELVATDREYEGRGLVRALMSWAHEQSAARGQLLQMIIGIPYFYRQFGYDYAVPLADSRPLRSPPPEVTGPGYAVREAKPADIGSMAALQDTAQAGADLSMPHAAATWRALVAHQASSQWLVERDGVPVATGRIAPTGSAIRLAELAALDAPATYALVHHARALAGEQPDGKQVRVYERPGTVAGAALAPYLGPLPDRVRRYYLRIPDPAALLEHLRPVLSARLAASELAGASGEAVLSLYRSHLRFGYRDGEVGPFARGGTMQWVGTDGAAVPPDLVPSLLFGPEGFAGLARSHPDVSAGQEAEPLMRTLFPPVHSDVLTFYLP